MPIDTEGTKLRDGVQWEPLKLLNIRLHTRRLDEGQ